MSRRRRETRRSLSLHSPLPRNKKIIWEDVYLKNNEGATKKLSALKRKSSKFKTIKSSWHFLQCDEFVVPITNIWIYWFFSQFWSKLLPAIGASRKLFHLSSFCVPPNNNLLHNLCPLITQFLITTPPASRKSISCPRALLGPVPSSYHFPFPPLSHVVSSIQWPSENLPKLWIILRLLDSNTLFSSWFDANVW